MTRLTPALMRHLAMPSPMIPRPTKPHVLPDAIAPLVLVLGLGGGAGTEVRPTEDMKRVR